jgi:hypothetical protein
MLNRPHSAQPPSRAYWAVRSEHMQTKKKLKLRHYIAWARLRPFHLNASEAQAAPQPKNPSATKLASARANRPRTVPESAREGPPSRAAPRLASLRRVGVAYKASSMALRRASYSWGVINPPSRSRFNSRSRVSTSLWIGCWGVDCAGEIERSCGVVLGIAVAGAGCGPGLACGALVGGELARARFRAPPSKRID